MVSLEQQRGEPPRARDVPTGFRARLPGPRWCLVLAGLGLAGCATGPRAAPASPAVDQAPTALAGDQAPTAPAGDQAPTAPAGDQAPTALAVDQERSLLDLRARNAGYARHIEELENRIFILEDQLDSRTLAAEQRAPATLPSAHIVRGSPRGGGKLGSASATSKAALPSTESSPGSTATASAPPAPAPSDEPPAPVQTSIVAEHAVDYAGDALQGSPSPLPIDPQGAPRPFLRLSPTPSSVEERAARMGAARVGRTAIARGTGTGRAPEPLVDPRPLTDAPTGSDPLHIYREALETLRAGHADLALAAFRRFLDANPRHDYADNALYWIGECHYDQRQFRAAERAFRGVVENYPHGNKVPDAMLKLGFTMQWLGDEAGGRSVLESLARAFPKHEAARLASERLAHPEPPPGRTGQPAAFGTILPLSTPQAKPAPRLNAGARAGSR